MCSWSWASCCRDSCSCCLWNSAMRICLWSCCFCLRARSSCCSCCSRMPGSVAGSGNWWSRRRSMGTAGGATGKGSAEATSTAGQSTAQSAGHLGAPSPAHPRREPRPTVGVPTRGGPLYALDASVPPPSTGSKGTTQRPLRFLSLGPKSVDVWTRTHTPAYSLPSTRPSTKGPLLSQRTLLQPQQPFLTSFLKVDEEKKQEKGSKEH